MSKKEYNPEREYLEGLCNMSIEEIKDFATDILEREKNRHAQEEDCDIDLKKQSNVPMDIKLKKLKDKNTVFTLYNAYLSPIKCGHDDTDLEKVQEQLSNKSFTKMCFSTNKENYAFRPFKPCELKFKEIGEDLGLSLVEKSRDNQDFIYNLVDEINDWNHYTLLAIFSIVKQLPNSFKDELLDTLIRRMTFDKKQTSTKENIFDDVLKLNNQFLKNEILKEIKNELDKIIDNNK
jgi:hypothetical protein